MVVTLVRFLATRVARQPVGTSEAGSPGSGVSIASFHSVSSATGASRATAISIWRTHRTRQTPLSMNAR
jgi:hypothetical protein